MSEKTTDVTEALSSWLENPSLTDLCLNGGGAIFGDFGFGMERLPEVLLQEELLRWTLLKLSQAGKSWDAKHPFIDFSLPSGHRVHAVFPPVATTGLYLSIRRLSPPSKMVPRWEGCQTGFDLLKKAVARHESILISGGTGSGKTTLLMDLLSHASPRERILILEDVPELTPDHPHWIRLTSRAQNADGAGEITLRMLLKQALRMRPDRIILGECRGSEVLELLQALNTGHRGTLATLHANSPREALRRIELLSALSGTELPWTVVRELISGGVQWIVQMKSPTAGTEQRARGIQEIVHIEGREGEQVLLRSVFGTPLTRAPSCTSGTERVG